MKKFDFLETEYHLEKKYLGFTGKGSFTYSGKIKSFSTVVKVNPDWKDCFITIQAQKDNEDIALIDLLKRNEVLKETNITINDNSSFTILYIIPTFTSSNKKRFDEIIEATISILKKNFYNPNVILTEEKEEEFSNFKYKEKFKSPEEIKIDYDNKKENIFLGILGVIGVSLLAMIAHIICDIVDGEYTFVVYALLASASCYVYKQLAGKLSKKSPIFIFIILIISLFTATVLSFIFSFYYFYRESGVLLSEAFQEVPPIIISDPEVRELFINNILICAGALTISFIISFFRIFKEEMEYLKFKKIRK
ncbi:hypothetical protein [Fusobacterium polymorphum]|uniref:hypothetical protein n=1 Tax=Fusobacterium nucleatum subsp. polymorphum TaxID=76857 RepID=UPI0030D4FAA3